MPAKYVKKRKTLPRRYQPGVIAKLRRNTRIGQHATARLTQLHEDQGGLSEMPVTLQSLAERFVFVENKAADQELAALEGRPFDLAGYLSTVQVLAKLADRLGYTRRQRTLRLADVLAQHEAEERAQKSRPAVVAADPVHIEAAPGAGGHQTE